MSLVHRLQEGRRAPREEVCHRCEVESPQHEPFAGLIVNISPFGCMVRCKQEAARGALLAVTLPIVGKVTGQVSWSMAGRMGIEFDNDIAIEPYCEMLERLSRSDSDLGIY